jgi:hypothetical protein
MRDRAGPIGRRRRELRCLGSNLPDDGRRLRRDRVDHRLELGDHPLGGGTGSTLIGFGRITRPPK